MSSRILSFIIQMRIYLSSVFFLARISLNNSYRLTFLGLLWSLLNPIIQTGIYFLVFSSIIRFNLENYTLYLISGILPWRFFTQTLIMSADSLIKRSDILHHCLVSKTIFPVADMVSNLFIFLISIFTMYLLIIMFSGGWSPRVLLFPLAVCPLVVASASGAIGVSFLAARVRDVSHLLGVLFSALFWLTPIVYPIDMGVVPSMLSSLVALNPIHYLILPVKLCLYGGEISLLISFSYSCAVAFVITLIAFILYIKLRNGIIFYI